ncbi:MAG: alpha/beta fold hydrolase [Victivallaceae bacterium]|nr:alpha/beta fold hydrolase [Victivallaceae bacterium]
MNPPADFVLVHGAWHGSWSFERVKPYLEVAGHRVFTPDLTGLGKRQHEFRADIRLETHIRDIATFIEQHQLDRIILCGHSYGGLLISAIADRMPERVAALVYLDAFVLENGENLARLIRREKNGGLPPLPAAYFGVASAADAAMIDSRCTPQPALTWRDPIKLAAPVGSRCRRVVYVRADGWPPTMSPSEERARERGWHIVHLPCGHEMMQDMPEATARILLDAAQPY